jgi:hypothetical protein
MISLRTLLNEGIFTSHPEDVVEMYMERWAKEVKSATGQEVKVSSDEDAIQIYMPGVKNFQKQITLPLWHKLLRTVNALGWYFAGATDIATHDHPFGAFDINQVNQLIVYRNPNEPIEEIRTHIAFLIEPRFGTKAGYQKFQKAFYHVTDPRLESKIAKVGLVPKSKSKMSYHPERVYLVRTLDDAIMMADFFYNYEQGDEDFDPEQHKGYSIYSVKLPRSAPLYEDPNLTDIDGFYTTINIPPNLLRLVKRLKTDDLGSNW